MLIDIVRFEWRDHSRADAIVPADHRGFPKDVSDPERIHVV